MKNLSNVGHSIVIHNSKSKSVQKGSWPTQGMPAPTRMSQFQLFRISYSFYRQGFNYRFFVDSKNKPLMCTCSYDICIDCSDKVNKMYFSFAWTRDRIVKIRISGMIQFETCWPSRKHFEIHWRCLEFCFARYSRTVVRKVNPENVVDGPWRLIYEYQRQH